MSNGNEIDLEISIEKLRSIKLELLEIDEEDLEPDKKIQLADSLQNCDTSLYKLENADLQNLSEEFKAREPELREAVIALEHDVKELDDAVAIIDVASAGLELAVEIAKLIK